ncbi:DNA processing protein [Paraglaciecola Antarctic GD virus 1]|nr:DNA processing protein [Paraglaciecola Antarctic GD virus 1]
MNLIIAGGRDFLDYKLLSDSVTKLIDDHYAPFGVTIIAGGALGADTLGEQYADEWDIQKIIKKAQWTRYGLSAGYRRNVVMASLGSHLIAFWNGHSVGTKHMIDIAKDFGIDVTVVKYT